MNPDLKGISPLLLLPTYNGWSRNRQAVVNFARNLPNTPLIEISSSALGHCFNIGYQLARKEHAKGKCTHVIMLHADVVPITGNWGQVLIEESLRLEADILSVVMPIKTQEGITSTAVERKATQDAQGWHPIRFTMKEIMQLPESFTHPRLMLNTGLMIIDMRKPWAHELVFDIDSRVDVDNFRPYFLPEDWQMSRFAQVNGASLWATRKVRAVHVGEAPFGNDKPWGLCATEGAMEVYLHEGGRGYEEAQVSEADSGTPSQPSDGQSAQDQA